MNVNLKESVCIYDDSITISVAFIDVGLVQHSPPSFTHTTGAGICALLLASVMHHQISAGKHMGREILPTINESLYLLWS